MSLVKEVMDKCREANEAVSIDKKMEYITKIYSSALKEVAKKGSDPKWQNYVDEFEELGGPNLEYSESEVEYLFKLMLSM